MIDGGRLAALCCGRRARFVIVLLWLAILGVAGPLAGKLPAAERNDASAWLPGSAESTRVLDLQRQFRSPTVLPAIVVYERAEGLTAADRAKIAADLPRLATVQRVIGAEVAGPIQAADGRAVQVVVPVDLGADDDWADAVEPVNRIRDLVRSGAGGLSVSVTGPAGYAADSGEVFEGIDGTLLYATLAVVILLLLLTYRSPTLWVLPVVSAGVALTTAQAVIYLLARHAGLTVNAQSAGILTVLVFGASTDYALLLVARYREELRRQDDRYRAMATALRRAAPAILASAGTVAAGLLTLLVAQTNSTRGLGPVAAIGVAVGLLAMLTLLPALLVTCGRWLFWPAIPAFGSAEPSERGTWARVGSGIARRPRAVWMLTTVVLGALALGTADLKANGLPNSDSFTSAPDFAVGADALARHFPAGSGQPVIVIGNAAASGGLRTALGGVPGVTQVTEPLVKGDLAYLEGTLADVPDSAAAHATVDRVRAAVRAVPGADARVGGNPAADLDAQRAARHDRNLVIPLVLAVVFLVLALLLRALLAPLLLMATVVLSFAAALGVSALVFDHVFGWPGQATSFPLFVFVFLVALGIDYNIFLMSRAREEAELVGARRGMLAALTATGTVITSAGAVLAGTFAVLATLPLVAFAEIGFAVAVGVLLDTLVVRSVLVTALNLDVGRAIWWPGRLSRRTVERTDPDRARSLAGRL